jgi:hypothetical protein
MSIGTERHQGHSDLPNRTSSNARRLFSANISIPSAMLSYPGQWSRVIVKVLNAAKI